MGDSDALGFSREATSVRHCGRLDRSDGRRDDCRRAVRECCSCLVDHAQPQRSGLVLQLTAFGFVSDRDELFAVGLASTGSTVKAFAERWNGTSCANRGDAQPSEERVAECVVFEREQLFRRRCGRRQELGVAVEWQEVGDRRRPESKGRRWSPRRDLSERELLFRSRRVVAGQSNRQDLRAAVGW